MLIDIFTYLRECSQNSIYQLFISIVSKGHDEKPYVKDENIIMSVQTPDGNYELVI